MRKSYHLIAVAALSLAALAPGARADDKSGTEKAWVSMPANVSVTDVAEVEPNNSLATAQFLGCDNVLRPAFLTPASDTDYVAFTATAGTIITVGTDADGTTGQIGDTRIRLFNDSGVMLATDDDSGPGLYSLLAFTATNTGTYYVGFAAFGTTTTGQYKGFITCQQPSPPPVNDQCAGAITISCGAFSLSGSTQFASNDYTPLTSGTGGCTGFTALGRDVVYLLVAAPGDSLHLRYTSSADASVYIITDCTNPTGTCVAGSDATLSGQTEVLDYMFTAPGSYYLILDSFGTNTLGTWTATGDFVCQATPVRRVSWGALKTVYR